jgi:hypothetical protein
LTISRNVFVKPKMALVGSPLEFERFGMAKERAINVIVTVDKQEFHRKRLILDSECMIPDDQGVTEEWILRVDGKEYGPANIDTLREWKAKAECFLQTKLATRMPSFGP